MELTDQDTIRWRLKHGAHAAIAVVRRMPNTAELRVIVDDEVLVTLPYGEKDFSKLSDMSSGIRRTFEHHGWKSTP